MIGGYVEASLPRPAKWSEEFAEAGEVDGGYAEANLPRLEK